MRDTTGLFKRLLELISEAERLEGPYAPSGKADAWQVSAASLLSQLCGSSHLYVQSFQRVTNGIAESSGSVDCYVKPGRAILEAVKADQLAGIQFDANCVDFTAGRPEVSGVLLRIEQLLQQLIQNRK